ncbi:Alpha,alpha-trehalose phosphorylase [compost metagenome]
MSIVHGFGGLRVQADRLILKPSNPGHWTSYSFKIMFRGSRLKVIVTDLQVTVVNETDVPAALTIHGKEYTVNGLSSVTAEGTPVTA